MITGCIQQRKGALCISCDSIMYGTGELESVLWCDVFTCIQRIVASTTQDTARIKFDSPADLLRNLRTNTIVSKHGRLNTYTVMCYADVAW